MSVAIFGASDAPDFSQVNIYQPYFTAATLLVRFHLSIILLTCIVMDTKEVANTTEKHGEFGRGGKKVCLRNGGSVRLWLEPQG